MKPQTQIDASKYLKAFQNIQKELGSCYHLTGDVLIVEKITGQELKKEVMDNEGKVRNLYLAGGTEKKIDGLDMNLPMFVRVLDVGPGFYDPSSEDDDMAPIGCDAEAGDIVLIGRMSVNWFSVFGSLVSTGKNEIGITRASEIQMRFKGEDGYNKFFSFLNDELSPMKLAA